MEKTFSNDVLGLSSIIKEAIPHAMVRYCNNFDDFYHGWDICPIPGVLIRLCVEINNSMNVRITKYLTITYDGSCQTRQMYLGPVPPSDEMEPDTDFIKQLLKNWNNVG